MSVRFVRYYYPVTSHVGDWTPFDDGTSSGEQLNGDLSDVGSMTWSAADDFRLLWESDTVTVTPAAGLPAGFKIGQLDVNSDTNPATVPAYLGVGTMLRTLDVGSVPVPADAGDLPSALEYTYAPNAGASWRVTPYTHGGDPWAAGPEVDTVVGMLGRWYIEFTFTVSPVSGPVTGGTAVTLTGGPFYPLGSTPQVSFGGEVATSVVMVDATTITCVAPAHAVGLVDVIVTLVSAPLDGSYGTYTAVDAFTYEPRIISVIPASGINSGGTAVTITGEGFIDGATVQFDGVEATDVVFVNSTTLTAVTPAAVLPGVSIVDVSVTETIDAVEYTPTLVDGYQYAAINRSPILYAGENSELLPPLPQDVTITGEWLVLPLGPSDVHWTQVSGPVTIDISPDDELITVASFIDYVPGEYTFRIQSTANPTLGISSASASRTITIPRPRAPKVENVRVTAVML